MTEPIPCPYSSSRFRQQNLPANRPFITPVYGAIIFTILSIISFILGSVTHFVNRDLFSAEIPYSDFCPTPGFCSVNLTISQTIFGPFYIYYGLTNLCQSNFLYGASKDWNQLRGLPYENEKSLSKCSPLIKDKNNSIYVPCGLLPRSVFTDFFTFPPEFPNLSSGNTAQGKLQELFKKPDRSYDSVGVKWMNLTLFPDGQADDRFVTWMDLAPFQSFRKLWAETKENAVLNPGNYVIKIESNYPVEQFGGKKSLIIAQVFWVGGRNSFFGIAFFVVVAVCVAGAVVLLGLYCGKALPLYKSLRKFAQEGGGGEGVHGSLRKGLVKYEGEK
jgi:hypothetical protein